MKVTIKEISTKKELKKFIKFPGDLYKDNKFYIPHIHSYELKTLSQDVNPAFEFCESKYWLAYKENIIVGRIAGIINYRYNKIHGIKYARFGWLDFIEDEEVLYLLLDTIENWAQEKKMDYIHGPLGFISFDTSGVLVEGFEETPTSFSHYNYPYYDNLIKKKGYKKEIDWIEYNIKMPDKIPMRIVKSASLIKKRYNVRNAEIRNKRDLLKYSDELFKLINTSYADIYGFTELTNNQVENLKNSLINFFIPNYTSFILDEKNELIGFGITIPSLSKAFKKSKGKLFPFGYFRIWKALRKNDTVDLLLIGVKPEYQNKGIHSLIFNKIGQTFIDNGIKYIETTRELEDNNKVRNLWPDYELRQHKRSRCYSKVL